MSVVTTTPRFPHVFYGVPVSAIGEDGDMIALGHHEPRRVLAAMRRYGREVCGMDDEDTFGYGFLGRAHLSMYAVLKRAHAVFTDEAGYEWYARLVPDPDPHALSAATVNWDDFSAIPVTVWSP